MALRQVRCPVLALNGTLDLQVDPEQNLPEIETALREAATATSPCRRLPGLNHLFQTAKTGSVPEYATIEETMNPAALDADPRLDPRALTVQVRTWCGIVAGITRDSSTKPRYSPFSYQGDW